MRWYSQPRLSPMVRLIAVLLFLTQLQPIAATFACMPAPHVQEEVCMPPDQQAAAPASRSALTTHAESCPTIGLCAPGAPAILAHEAVLTTVPTADGEGLLAVAASIPQAPHAPPFHPPRV